MHIAVIGTGYVGLVTGACLAELGHTVTCLDTDAAKIQALQAGMTPIFEPGLDELVDTHTANGRLGFTTDYAEAIPGSQIVFIAVGTPSLPSGQADLSFVYQAVDSLAPLLTDGATVAVKSTVPIGTTEAIDTRLAETIDRSAFSVVSNPEFLRQGAAVDDFMEPNRIVVGATDDRSSTAIQAAFAQLIDAGAPTVLTNPPGAELIKYASNAFLAVKLSFINEMADLGEQTGADIADVALGIGLDPRITPAFLNAGPGYGGSCLPKDTQALLHSTNAAGVPSRIVAAAVDVNRQRRPAMAQRILSILDGASAPKRVGVLGITFKANTDDLRESPAIEIVRNLVGHGVDVRLYDPQGMPRAKDLLSGVTFCDDPYGACTDVDAVVILTEWDEFRTLDFKRLVSAVNNPVIVDLRNLLDADSVTREGFTYHSVGRPTRSALA